MATKRKSILKPGRNERKTPILQKPLKKDTTYLHDTLINEVSETSGYPRYQIEDILDHYVYHVSRALLTYKPVEIKRLGRLLIRFRKAMPVWSNLTFEWMTAKPKNHVKFIPSITLMNTVNIDRIEEIKQQDKEKEHARKERESKESEEPKE